MSAPWNEDDIAAHVDGAIEDPAEAARIARIVAEDPAAAQLAAQMAALNAELREAFSAPLSAPVPPRIAAVLEGEPGKVSAFPLRRRRAPGWGPSALAASLALGIGLAGGLAGGLMLPRGGEETGGMRLAAVSVGAHVPGAPLAAALEHAPSGRAADGVRPLFTFRDGAGRPCREYEALTEADEAEATGIACRGAEGAWTVSILVATAPAQTDGDGGFAPASGASDEALSAMLDTLGAGPVLGPEDEAALIAGGWAD